MAFPASPTNGQTTSVNGITYIYNSTDGAWAPSSATANASIVTTGGTTFTGAVTFSVSPTFSAPLVLPIGNATTPSYTFSGATTTGLYSTGSAGNLAITTNGTNAVFIDSGQKVGVGTATPTQKLHLVGGSALIDSTNYLYLYNTNYFLRASSGLEIQSNDYTRFMTNGANERIRIDSTGNVGIGTTTPADKLDITGNLYFSASSPTISFNSGGPVINVPSSNTLTFKTSSLERLRIDSSGNMGLGTTSPAATFHVAAPSTTAYSLTWGASSGQILRSENSELAIGLHNATPYPLYMQGRNNLSAVRDIVLQPLGGKIGVGTTANNAPYAPLTISATATNTVTTVDTTTTSGIMIAGTNALVRLQMGVGSSTLGPYSGWIQASYDNTSIGGTNGTEPLLLNPNGGSVGIGVTSPGATLDVAGIGRFVSPNSGSTGAVVIRDNASAANTAYLQFVNNAASVQYAALLGTTTGLGCSNTFYPTASNSVDLGTSTLRWRNIYTNDLHLSNGIGDYTVVEGEEDLFLVNNKNGKTFKFALIEVDPSIVPPKASS